MSADGAREPARSGPALRRGALALGAGLFALVWARLWAPGFAFGRTGWPEGLLLLTLTLAALGAAARRLPWQNVLLVSGVIALMGAAGQGVGCLTAPPAFPGNAPHAFEDGFAWEGPLMWVVAILTARGVGRLILRPWRAASTYGFRVLGLTVILVVGLDAGLEPFTAGARLCTHWRLGEGWLGQSWAHCAGVALVALLMLAMVTPSLISKKPGDEAPVWQPLVVWVGLSCLFVTTAIVTHCWLAACLAGLTGILPALLALWFGRSDRV